MKLIRPLKKGDLITYDHFEQSPFINCYADRDMAIGEEVTEDDLEKWTAEEIEEAKRKADEYWELFGK